MGVFVLVFCVGQNDPNAVTIEDFLRKVKNGSAVREKFETEEESKEIRSVSLTGRYCLNQMEAAAFERRQADRSIS